MKGWFVTGIGTDVGKTVVAAILAESKGASYWKPVQCGSLEATDSDRVRSLAPAASIFPEAYRLRLPASPHAAAAAEGVTIALAQLKLPISARPMVVEGAGGLMVPLNHHDLMLDLIAKLGLPVIVVARHYLGSINHTLLTAAVLRARGLVAAGIVFIGDEQPTTEAAIHEFSGLAILGRVPEVASVDRAFIAREARREWCHDLN